MSEINIRKANSDDLPSIIQLLADDLLGAQREDSTMPPNVLYLKAWNNISKNNNSEIFVVEDQGKIIGVAQLDYLQYLTYQGGRRAQIEGVRVRQEKRVQNIPKAFRNSVHTQHDPKDHETEGVSRDGNFGLSHYA